MSHLYLSAAHKSSGKTTLSIGLCAALAESGQKVQAFKKGPDYIDPLWLGQASGNPCYNLDFYTMSRDEIYTLFDQKIAGADIGIVEGNKGLYDGLDLDGSNSNAALAAMLDAPVVLVLDSQGMTRGIAPLILGYQAFDSNIRIAGVILNKVGGARHESKLRKVIEHYTDVPVIGAVRKSEELSIDERHLGLVPSNEADASTAQIARMGSIVRDQVNLDLIRDIAKSTSYEAKTDEVLQHNDRVEQEKLTVAYAKDEAFGFYYADDLEALASAGAELKPFSPIDDAELPSCDALFLGGGFPETHIDLLTKNSAMLNSIKNAIESGLPTYAECGGLMYLCRDLTWDAKQGKMVGLIPADVVMHVKPQGRGYVKLQETASHPWPRRDDAEAEISAHEFHYSGLENLPEGMTYAYEVVRGYGIDGNYDGICYRNLLASYAHLRNTSGNRWASRFIDFVQDCKGKK